jgi:hypothetical protein
MTMSTPHRARSPPGLFSGQHEVLGQLGRSLLRQPRQRVPGPEDPQAPAQGLTKILDNPDPRGLWKIADARIGERNIGKEILMERDWNGEIRLDDAQAMQRFNHYTGRSK